MNQSPKTVPPARIQKPLVPADLTSVRLIFLFKLWAAGYENGVYADKSECRSGQVLCRLGYAAQDPTCLNHFRVTEEGIDRLQSPMKLYRSSRSHLRLVKP